MIYELVQRLLGRSDIYIAGSLFMRRWRLLHIRGFGIRIHCIERSDADRECHDHPFTFLSVILWGGYWECRQDGSRRWCGPGSIVFRKAETLHRLELPDGKRAWTFVVRGPLRREWGFMTDAGWQHWSDFVRERYGVQKRSGFTPGTAERPYASRSSY